MAFFEPFLRRSPTLSFVRCTVCVPGPVPRAVADSVKLELSKAVRSDAGPALARGKVSRIRGFVARSSRTAAGGTSSLFNHAHRSHPALLAALRELIERDVPGERRVSAGRVRKKRRRGGAPTSGSLMLAAMAAVELMPPGSVNAAARIARESPVKRASIVASVWPYIAGLVRAKIAKLLHGALAVGISFDRWVVAGGYAVVAVNLHFCVAWKKHVVNLGALPFVQAGMHDPRRLLDAFGVRQRVFGVVARHLPVALDGNVLDIVGDCFRGICIFTDMADVVQKVVNGHIEPQLQLHGDGVTTIDAAISLVARCVSLIKDTPEATEVHENPPSAVDQVHAGNTLIPAAIAPIPPAQEPQPGLPDLITDSVDAGVTVASRAAAAAAAAREAAAVVADVPPVSRSPKPWLRGCFMSMLSAFEALIAIHSSVHGMNEEHLQPLRELMDEHWVVVGAVVKVLTLVKEHVGVAHGWCELPDAQMRMINLVCAICDRLAEIEVLADQSLGPSTQLPLRQYIDDYLRSRQIRQEDAVGTSPFIAILEGWLLYHLLDGLYPIMQPLLEYMPKQAYRFMAMALDPRFCSLASLITLNKKLLQGSRLVYEKEMHSEEGDTPDDRIRKRVRSMSVRYDEGVMVPLMNSMNSRVSGGGNNQQNQAKFGQDSEEGLFEETFEPTDDWKNRHQLLAELAKFRSFKKNISRSASFEECLAWWASNHELFPNISTLFQKVISVPATQTPLQRVLGTASAKMQVARRRLPKSGLDDLIFIHENLTQEMLCDIQGVSMVKEDTRDEDLFGDDELLDLVPDLFVTD